MTVTSSDRRPRDRSSSTFLLLTVTALVASSPGCSFIFVEAPPPREQRAHGVYCTTSQLAPGLDVAVAGLQLVRVVLALLASDSDYANSPVGRDADIAFGTGMLALFTSSAAYGIVETGECRELRGEVEIVAPRKQPPPRPQQPNWGLGPPSPTPQQRQRRLEEQEEEEAVQARASAMAAEQAKAAGEAAHDSANSSAPQPARKAPPVRQ